MTAAAVIPSSRRVSAGITPAPGAASRLPAWWGREDWLAELCDALDARGELLRAHHVSRDAVVKLAERMAHFADFRTGRDARPTNERLTELCQCSLSTVQRGRRVLKALGLCVQTVAGRSIMTRAERFAAWERGSSHRRVAATFALCSRRRRAPKVRATGVGEKLSGESAPVHPVERDTPPGALSRKLLSHPSRTHLRRRTDSEDRRSAPSSYRGGHSGGLRRLAEGVTGRLWWLRGCSWRRIAPTLARLHRAGWTPRDVDLAVRDALAARGWRVPRDLRTPAAYLAGLLRDLDPADRPTAAEEWALQCSRREDAYRLALAGRGAPCPHGMPAGDVPSPLRSILACPDCRRLSP